METLTSIDVTQDGPLTWVTLNRPEKLNALSDQLLRELDLVLESERTSDSRVVIIRGAGRAFSAGFDISDSDEIDDFDRDSIDVRDRQASHMERWLRIWDHPKPFIAAVHGYCLAGASLIALFCDLTVVAEDAVITNSPNLPIGGGFMSPLWVSLVGPKRAKQMSFLAGERIDGKTAVEWGWANYAVPGEKLEASVRDLALRIAQTPPSLLRMKKLAINRVLDLQGFRTAALMGAETNALIHETHHVNDMHALIREHGLKEVLRRFAEGEL